MGMKRYEKAWRGMKRHKGGRDGMMADTKAEEHATMKEGVETSIEIWRRG